MKKGTLHIVNGKVHSYELEDSIGQRLDGFTEADALGILKTYGWEKNLSTGLPWEDHVTKVQYNPPLLGKGGKIFKSEDF